jgi:probable phosphoglycerate mutase
MTLQLLIEADGGSRGNPGLSGSGAVVIDRQTGEILIEISEYIGTATNNVAEYRALLAGVREALALDPHAHIEVRMDSKLVIEQMSGSWKIKHPDMQKLAIQVHQLLNGHPVRWVWIPREQNSRADALANQAMDRKESQVLHAKSGPAKPVEASTPVASTVEFNSDLPSSVRAPGGVTKPLTTVILVRHGRTALTESLVARAPTPNYPPRVALMLPQWPPNLPKLVTAASGRTSTQSRPLFRRQWYAPSKPQPPLPTNWECR